LSLIFEIKNNAKNNFGVFNG